jgi:hypothetical protein
MKLRDRQGQFGSFHIFLLGDTDYSIFFYFAIASLRLLFACLFIFGYASCSYNDTLSWPKHPNSFLESVSRDWAHDLSLLYI